MYAARRTGLKKEMFGYLPGGYARLLRAFKNHLENLGVDIRLGEKVTTLTQENNAVHIQSGAGTLGPFERAVLTVPSRLVTRILPDMNDAERQLHASIQYQGIVCVSLLLDRLLPDFYVTNITDEIVPFTGVINMSALVDRSEFGGRSLIYLPFYVPEEDSLFEESDEAIYELSMGGLEAMYPAFRRNQVKDFRVSRVRRVMPIPTLNYSENLAPRQTSIAGVHVVNSAQIVNGTLNVNETVKLAESAAAELLVIGLFRIQCSTNQKKRNMSQLASLSLDLDNKWSYLKTHGDAGWESYPSYLDIVCPRVVGLLEQLDLTITFFIVGQDAALEKNHQALRCLADAGHEIANHSFHHEPWLHLYSEQEVAEELQHAEDSIWEATGKRTQGFRGPGFSVSPTVVQALDRMGLCVRCFDVPNVSGASGTCLLLYDG